MTIPYNLGIPNPPNNPSADVPLMKQNTNSINQIIGVDHVTFGASPPVNGYHTVIHQTLQGSDPATIAGINQIYSKQSTTGFGTDTQLWSKTGLGGTEQLTGNNASTNGYAFCAGMILQWGTVTQALNASVSGDVSFSPNFPSSCFNLQVSLFGANVVGTVSPGTISAKITNNTQFHWVFNLNSGVHYQGFYWFAIGK